MLEDQHASKEKSLKLEDSNCSSETGLIIHVPANSNKTEEQYILGKVNLVEEDVRTMESGVSNCTDEKETELEDSGEKEIEPTSEEETSQLTERREN